jgi:molybdopterin synthase sulfur carrier subunit
MAKITIRYWAAAKEAAGVAEETIDADTLGDLLNTVVASRKPDGRLAAVLARSSFLVNADPVGRATRQSIVLDEGDVVEVLPPFAGG